MNVLCTKGVQKGYGNDTKGKGTKGAELGQLLAAADRSSLTHQAVQSRTSLRKTELTLPAVSPCWTDLRYLDAKPLGARMGLGLSFAFDVRDQTDQICSQAQFALTPGGRITAGAALDVASSGRFDHNDA